MQELFLEKFADDAYRNALKDRKKSIIYDNLCKLALCSYPDLFFIANCSLQFLIDDIRTTFLVQFWT